MLASITFHSILVFIHVTAAVVGLGATFALAVGFPLAVRLGDPRLMPFVHKLSLEVTRKLASPALLLILITGIWQAVDGDFDFGALWISGAFVIVLALGGLQGAVLHADGPQAGGDGREGARRRGDGAERRVSEAGAARGCDRRPGGTADRGRGVPDGD